MDRLTPKRLVLVAGIAIWCGLLGYVWGTEQLDLTTPIQGSAITSYKVLQLTLGTTPPVIDWTVVDNTGKTMSGSYNGSIAATFLNQINTGNFTVTSLQKKIILRLQADGKLGAGTVSGSP